MTEGSNGQGGAPPGNLTEAEFEAFLRKQREHVINWIATMAGVKFEIAEKCLLISMQQAEQIQGFLQEIATEASAKSHPLLGIRLHRPNGKFVDYVAPKFLPKLIGGSWVYGHDADIGCYMATLGMLTSVEGRAIMAAQGYRIEFLQLTAPPKDFAKRRQM